MSKLPLLPPRIPAMGRTELEQRVLEIDRHIFRYPLLVVGLRGYYRDTMGSVGKNDRGIYDDAAFVVSTSLFLAVNFNTDPSAYRKGQGKSEKTKGMAVLNPGLWFYRIGLHRGLYPALIQDSPVTVTRDGLIADYTDTGMFGMNIHPGGIWWTNSLGCQTVHPSQWDIFFGSIRDEARRLKMKRIPYLLSNFSE